MNYHINKILKEKTITSFLEEKGIFPDKKSGEKIVYKCPIHNEKDPSFIVYPVGTKGRDYQTYYCFGCHDGITLINLKSALEGITVKDSIKSFLKDIKIDDKEVMKSIIEDIKSGNLDIEDKKEIETTLLLINSTCREHLAEYNDEEEIEFFNKFFKKVDEVARSRNIDLLEGAYDTLMRGKVNRVEKFQKRQEEKDTSSLNWNI